MKIKTKLPPTKVKWWTIANASGRGTGNPPVTISVIGVSSGRKTVRPQETINYTVGKKGWVGKKKEIVRFITGEQLHGTLIHPRK